MASKDLVLYASKRKLAGYTLLSATLTSIGIITVILPGDPMSLSDTLGAYAGIALFVGMTLLGLARLTRSNIRVVVSHDGIRINQPWLGLGFFRWSEIRALRARPDYFQRVLDIVLRDPQTLLAHQNRLQRVLFFVWQSRPSATGIVGIGDAALGHSAQQLLAEIRRRFGDELAANGVELP